MSKILVISGHNQLEHSTANKTILTALEKHYGDKVTVRQLDKLYPNFRANFEAEKPYWEEADVIVMQFPMYWYNLPGQLKTYIEDVLQFGWAYGTATKLAGKRLLLSFTTGAPAANYDGEKLALLPDYFYNMRDTAKLCAMEYVAPVHMSSATYIPGVHDQAYLDDLLVRVNDHIPSVIAAIDAALER